MPSPQPPLLLVDNVLDTVTLYPLGTLTTSSELTGREGFRVADYRRERSWWQTATSAVSHWIAVDLGAGNTRNVDSVWFDRGHNLSGRQVEIDYSDDGATWTTLVTLTFPAITVIGGDPTLATLSQTEEGASFALFGAAAAPHRYWRILYLGAAFIPIVTGIILGARTQLLSYSAVYDPDQGGRTQPQQISTAGYAGTDRPYQWRTCLLDLRHIGSAEYDGTVRALRRLLFERNQPWFLCLNYGLNPERGWLFQYDGTGWAFPTTRTLRDGQIRGREVGPLLT